MKKKLLIILSVLLFLSLVYRIFTYHRLTVKSDPHADENLHARYEYALPHSISFAGEKIPLEDTDVRERMIHLLIKNSYQNSGSLELHKLSGRWFPLIEGILKQHGVPDDFKYLVLVESGFGSDVSVKGASGFWQFIPSTAIHYGLEINKEVDERYDPEKSTHAACRYILDSYKRFKNWTLSAASYNMGPDALDRQLRKQRGKSYYDLILSRETSVYLFKILAMKEIISRPGHYGYRISKKQLYRPLPYRSVPIDSAITDLRAFAASQHTSMELLKMMNPWLTGNRLTNASKKKYVFKILKPGNENLPGLSIQEENWSFTDTVALKQDSVRE